MFYSMKIFELYKEVVCVVCNITGINETDIIYSCKEECADARYLLVKALSFKLTDNEISSLIHRTRQGVNSIKNTQKLSKWSVASNWKEISKELNLLASNL